MTTYPLPTLACTIDATGISAPSYTDILLSLQASYYGIYGSDSDLDADSQDGQWLAVHAAAINDSNNATIAAYNGYSPTFAQGAGLSSVVKINGIRRQPSTNSTATETIVGTYGTVITDGQVGDANGKTWNLPTPLTIPIAGTVDVTVTAVDSGAIQATAGTINKILTPTAGWASATNAADAVPGDPVEPDAALRQRQTESVAIPSLSVLDGILGAVANTPGVERHTIYDNSTDSTDSNGIPSHTIAVVVEGGSTQPIIDAIGSKKTPGTGTFGTISGTYVDPESISQPISYEPLTVVPITVEVDVTRLVGWVSSTADAIKAAVAAYISAQVIGEDVYYRRLYAPAALNGAGLGLTYNLTAVLIARTGSPTAADVAIAFNEAASCVVTDITVVPT